MSHWLIKFIETNVLGKNGAYNLKADRRIAMELGKKQQQWILHGFRYLPATEYLKSYQNLKIDSNGCFTSEIITDMAIVVLDDIITINLPYVYIYILYIYSGSIRSNAVVKFPARI